MSRRYIFILLALWASVQTNAQETLVCDGLTKFPLRDIKVVADGKLIGKTTYLGLIQLPDSFQTATFSGEGFRNEKLTREEVLRDTVFLYPAKNYLNEVVVIGKHIVSGKDLLTKMPKRDILEEAPAHAVGEFDFGLMLDKRLRRDKKHVAQLRKIFKKLDGTDTEDPIMRAYRETMLEKKAKRIAEERRKEKERREGYEP